MKSGQGSLILGRGLFYYGSTFLLIAPSSEEYCGGKRNPLAIPKLNPQTRPNETLWHNRGIHKCTSMHIYCLRCKNATAAFRFPMILKSK
jgi:hypothetical protein